MQPPSHIVEEVKRYDPLLNLRWSKEKRKYVLERKVDTKTVPKSVLDRVIPRPVLFRRDNDKRVKEIILPENSDRYIHYHRKTVPVAFMDKLDRRLFWWIFSHDSFALGRGQKAVREMESRERAAEQRKDQKQSESVRDMGGEAYDHMKHISGERMFMSGGK